VLVVLDESEADTTKHSYLYEVYSILEKSPL